MNIDAIPTGRNAPDDVNVIIEVPIGGEPIKYEIDKASGALFLDRFLYTPMRYPGNYGFIPHTLCGDGDPLDAIVMSSRPIVPGAVVRCRPVGVLFMEDDGGKDEKVICLPVHKLTRIYDGSSEVLLEDVDRFALSYFDLTRGATTNALSVKEVQIEAILLKEVLTINNTDEIISARFMLRNRRVSS